MLKTKEEIDTWLTTMKIKNYEIFDDLTVTVNGNVLLDKKNLDSLPVSFNHIEGFFSVANNKLTSLKGCPYSVRDGFHCEHNLLTSLEYCPQIFDFGGGVFDCSHNQLTTLEYAPKSTIDDFNCSNNNLTSLLHAPDTVSEDFICDYNQLKSLEHSPKEVGGHFFCAHNLLESLEGCPKTINKNFDISHNKLTSLKNGPSHIVGNIFANQNNLLSLDDFTTFFGVAITYSGTIIPKFKDFYITSEAGENILQLNYKELQSIRLHEKLQKNILPKNDVVSDKLKI